MSRRHALALPLALFTAGIAFNATAQEGPAETVTVMGTRDVPMVARCEHKAMTTLPEGHMSAAGKLGLAACLNEGTLESLFNSSRERINALNQLLVAYQNLTELRELGTPLQDGDALPRLPNFSVTRRPDGTYSFIWDVKTTRDGGLPTATSLTGLISTRPAL